MRFYSAWTILFQYSSCCLTPYLKRICWENVMRDCPLEFLATQFLFHNFPKNILLISMYYPFTVWYDWGQLCLYLGDVVLNAIGDATKRNSRFEGFSVSSKDMIASVIFLLNGGFPFIIFLLLSFNVWKSNRNKFRFK